MAAWSVIGIQTYVTRFGRANPVRRRTIRREASRARPDGTSAILLLQQPSRTGCDERHHRHPGALDGRRHRGRARLRRRAGRLGPARSGRGARRLRRRGEVAGGVTGGCVEPAVIREANEVLNGSRGRLVHYGLDDEDGFDVGLTCGGRSPSPSTRSTRELVRRSPTLFAATARSRSRSGSTRSASASRRSSIPASARERRRSRPPPARCSRSARARSSRRRRRAGLRRVVRAAPEPLPLRRERPRRGARPDRQAARLPRHRLRPAHASSSRASASRSPTSSPTSGPTSSSRARRSMRARRSA